MIFATAGTLPFDALTRGIDEAVAAGAITEDVLLQIGRGGDYVPRHCRYFRVYPTLEPFERSADLIVSHEGIATTLEVLMIGRPLISVSNPARIGNRQHEFLEALEALGLIAYCRSIDDLPRLIARWPRIASRLREQSRLALELGGQLAGLGSARSPLSRRFRHLVNRMVQRYEIDAERAIRPSLPSIVPWPQIIDPRRADLSVRARE